MKRRYTSCEDERREKVKLAKRNFNVKMKKKMKKERERKRKKEENGRIKRQARMEEDPENGEKKMREYVS